MHWLLPPGITAHHFFPLKCILSAMPKCQTLGRHFTFASFLVTGIVSGNKRKTQSQFFH